MKRILIVEDDEALTHVLSNKLKINNFEVAIVQEGRAALDLIAKEKFDLMLLDLTMPGLDGFHVLAEIKTKKINLPVIIMSNLAQSEDLDKARAMGAENYLVKTNVTPEIIVKEIKNRLGE